MNLHEDGRVPSVFIIDEYIDDELYSKVSVCNNHVLNYLIGTSDVEDIWNCPFQDHGDRYVITRLETIH